MALHLVGNVKFHILPVVVGTAIHTANSGGGSQPAGNLLAQVSNLSKERCLQVGWESTCKTLLFACSLQCSSQCCVHHRDVTPYSPSQSNSWQSSYAVTPFKAAIKKREDSNCAGHRWHFWGSITFPTQRSLPTHWDHKKGKWGSICAPCACLSDPLSYSCSGDLSVGQRKKNKNLRNRLPKVCGHIKAQPNTHMIFQEYLSYLGAFRKPSECLSASLGAYMPLKSWPLAPYPYESISPGRND